MTAKRKRKPMLPAVHDQLSLALIEYTYTMEEAEAELRAAEAVIRAARRVVRTGRCDTRLATVLARFDSITRRPPGEQP